jgi:ribokinase
MANTGAIVVVGSLNMDLVVRCPIPRPGQTVAGGDLREVPGGKGANQAVAAARLAAGRCPVRMVGRVGDDAFGDRLVRQLDEDGVDADHVGRLAGVPSGTAVILVDDGGENAIVVSPGANGRLAPADVPDLAGAAVVLLQLEVPAETVAAAIGRARGAWVILDPAPVPAGGTLPAALYGVDLITPNQTEAEALTGVPVASADDAGRAAAVLVDRGAKRVVVKLGAGGCAVSERTDGGRIVTTHVPGFAVTAVDTTAAGDSFNGALAVALAEGMGLLEAARFANAAGALAATRPGAQSSLPTRAEVDRLVSR